ncbi:hypothetical protein CSKR_202758, partial [Clonorchis sinensis]
HEFGRELSADINARLARPSSVPRLHFCWSSAVHDGSFPYRTRKYLPFLCKGHRWTGNILAKIRRVCDVDSQRGMQMRSYGQELSPATGPAHTPVWQRAPDSRFSLQSVW